MLDELDRVTPPLEQGDRRALLEQAATLLDQRAAHLGVRRRGAGHAGG